EVITIGGICGKIVKAKDKEDVLTIQVGADKTKFEIMRWAISKVVSEAPAQKPARMSDVAEDAEDAEAAADAPKPSLPKRLKKKTAEEEAGIEE
ncbi:MAG: preprotein translocase subunit YajC, partial [Clostridiales Family XIII bacterium]|nr:preprotein translocase subunit YajC [Clostridiales Family XIII bacterium]